MDIKNSWVTPNYNKKKKKKNLGIESVHDDIDILSFDTTKLY